MHIVGRKRILILSCLVLALLSFVSSAFLSSQSVFATDAGPVEGGCIGDGFSTGLSSPFSKTPGMCIGDGGNENRFFQFAIKLAKPVAVSVTSSAKNMDGSSLSFVQQSSTLYVSKPGSNFMGYHSLISSTSCVKTDPMNNVSITIKGPGSDNSQTLSFNLCSYVSSNTQSLIYATASNIKASDGTPTGSTGTIRGNLGIERTDSLVPDRYKKGLLEKQGIVSIKLSGPSALSGDNSADWYTLANGKLNIPDLKPGVYSLSFTYNDRAVLSQEGGDAGWVSGDMSYEFKNIVVVAGKDTWIGNSSDSKVYYQKNDITTTGTTEASDGNGSATSCAVDGVGWLICPVMTFLTKLNDGAFSFLSRFLEVPPKVFSDPATKSAWEAFRNIANVAFVIAFLVIIYSQITGGGVSNYGLKKLLPKLIIAAVLVNVSFFVCEIAVDVSNIVGSSMYKLIGNVNIGTAGGGGGELSSVWATAGAAILGTAAVIGLIALIIFAPTSLLALALIILILIARQAFIIILIVISPLAFVAYLLPNTEDWFKKWWKAFSTILMVFPIIAIVFGGSTLASKILLQVSQDGAAGGDDDQMMKIIAAGVLAIPLFAVPLLLKGAMSAAGNIGTKLSGLQDKATGVASRGAKDQLKRRGENIEAKMAGSNNRFARLAGGYRNRRAFGHKTVETDTARRQQEALTEQILRNPGNYTPRQLAEAKSASLKEYNEEVGREKSTMSDLKHNQLMDIVKDKSASVERRAAAAGMIGSRSYRKGHQELLDYVGDQSHVVGTDANGDAIVDDAIKTVQQQTAYDMKDQPLGMGDQDKSALGEGKWTKPTGANGAGVQRTVSQEALLQRFHDGKVSEQAFASMNPDDLAMLMDLKAGGHLTTQAQQTIDNIVDNLQKPEMAAVYASSKENARKIHVALHT